MMQFNDDLLDFITQSPTPFHAVANVVQQLTSAGFTLLSEGDNWSLVAGGRYCVVRRDTSIVAFIVGTTPSEQTGFRILGAHTDSPCIKIKPQPDVQRHGYHQVGIDVYGGVLLAPWFDRDLSLAGRVSVLDDNAKLVHHLVDFKRPIATIPSLAIHLDRNANNERSINAHEQMLPILWQADNEFQLNVWLKEHLEAQGHSVTEVLDSDLSFYDVQAGATIGVRNEFLASARLDNLLSCYVATQSLLAAESDVTCIMVLNDHEEVGSHSTAGACSNLLTGVIERLIPAVVLRHRAISQSMMMSIDNAHGIHPNFSAKHDGNHAPQLNKGPVLKFDANQGYATQTAMSSLLRLLAKQVGVNLQSYAVRADMRCGSTIGPITATLTGIETLDIGVPTFAMHSIRELAGAADPWSLRSLLVAFLNYRAAN
jgi:aspartyl aminopeptidase